MKTEHFVLKDSGLHYVKDMPEKPTGVFRTEEIPVANHEELFNELCKNYPLMDSSSNEGVLMELECEVEIRYFTDNGIPLSKFGGYYKSGEGVELKKPVSKAFVKLKEEMKNKKVLVVGSNKIHLSQTIKTALGQDAVTKEEDNKLWNEIIERCEDRKTFGILSKIDLIKQFKSNFTITKR